MQQMILGRLLLIGILALATTCASEDGAKKESPNNNYSAGEAELAFSPQPNTAFNELPDISVTFDDDVFGLDDISNYELTGSGSSGLQFLGVTSITGNTFQIELAGEPNNGAIIITISGLINADGDQYEPVVLEYTFDSIPAELAGNERIILFEGDSINIEFSEKLDPDINAEEFSLTGAAAAGLTIDSIHVSGSSIEITTNGEPDIGLIEVNIPSLADLAGNMSDPTEQEMAYDLNMKIFSSPGNYSDRPHDIEVDDRYIYVGGQGIYTSGQTEWRIEKYDKVLGTRDTDFGTAGILQFFVSPDGNDRILGLELDGNNLYAFGSTNINGAFKTYWRAENYATSTGVRNSNFDEDGFLITQADQTDNSPQSLKQDDDYLYLIGNRDNQVRIEKRLKSDGSLDSGFGIGGTLRVDEYNSSYYTVEVHGDHIYIADGQYLQKFRKSDGAIETDFAGDGEVYTGLLGTASAMLVQDGIVFLAKHNFTIIKFDSTTGDKVSGFGSGGEIAGTQTNGRVASVVSDGESIYIVGTGTDWNFRIEKRDMANGDYDLDFGLNGVSSVTIGDQGFLHAGTMDENWLYVTGFYENGSDEDWATYKIDPATGEFTP